MHSQSATDDRPAVEAADEPDVTAETEAVDVDLASLTPSEEAALGRVRALSFLLDEAVRIPGTSYRIGLDPLVGLLPVIGDGFTAVLSLYPVVEASRMGVPKRAVAKMALVVAIDAVVGSIPVVGDLFDAAWKANERNRRTLERHLQDA